MSYILMHKNISVAELELTEDGKMVAVWEVLHKENAPTGENHSCFSLFIDLNFVL